MTTHAMVKQLNDMAKAGKPAMVQHAFAGRIGPCLEAKPLGFGTASVMVRIDSRAWLTVCPLTWNIVPAKP